MHCAEVPEQCSETDQMIAFKPDRLGHCCHMNPLQIERVHELNIPVEVCPTSNLSCVPEARNIVKFLPHLQQLHALGHNIIICTDDTMLFSTNLSTEMFEYIKAFEVPPAQMKALLLRNCEAIFDPSCREWLVGKIESYRV